MHKVAVWYIWAGVGHYRPAKAIADQLAASGYHVDLINPLEVLARSDSLWGKLLVGVFDFGNALFKLSMTHLKLSNDIQRNPGVIGGFVEGNVIAFFKLLQRFVGRRVSSELSLREYEAVICTHPVACGLAVGIREKQQLHLPIMNVFPDEANGLTCNYYLHPNTYMVVNSEKARNYFTEVLRFDPARVFVIGYTGDPMLVNNRQKIYERVQRSLKAGKLNLGIYLGGYCPDSQKKAILAIIRQLALWMKEGRATVRVITGPHHQFDRQVRRLIQGLGIEKQIVVGRSDDLKEVVSFGHEWMKNDINVMFSRPSELSFYSLITGIPHILFPAVGGQEYDMREMLQQFADVKEYQAIRNGLPAYLDDKDQLIKLSHDLYHSGYNVNGAPALVKVLESVV